MPHRAAALAAEHSVGPAGEDRGHPFTLPRQVRSADRVNARAYRMESALCDSPSHRLGRVADRQELEERENVVLPGCECPDATRTRSGIKRRHHNGKSPDAVACPFWAPPHAPPGASLSAGERLCAVPKMRYSGMLPCFRFGCSTRLVW